MTTRKKTTAGKGEAGKMKRKKATIRDLDVKSKGKHIKGGDISLTYGTIKQEYKTQ